ncbi:hypothetical protein AX16_004055 [Volvariella volvacea WC 439]|nr:hypothetical protein AX16_004055 [Volvariella volvacea WC 439]
MGKRMAIGISGITKFLDSIKSAEPERKPEQDPAGGQSAISTNSRSATEGQSHEPPAKKRRVTAQEGFVSGAHKAEYTYQPVQKYYAKGLATHYSHPAQVPEHLQKYYAQRLRLFSLYSEPPGCLLDEEGWFSVTPEAIADQIAERCRCDTILDAFCGVGGNAIAFAKTCQRVIALDNSPTRLALARHNAQIYGVADRIEFILGDYISFAESYIRRASSGKPSSSSSLQDNSARKIDVIFLSPPWGGLSYLNDAPPNSSTSTPGPNGKPPGEIAETADVEEHPTYSLASIKPIHGSELFKLSRKITKNIAFYLPRNTSLEEISALIPGGSATPSTLSTPSAASNSGDIGEMVEVEEEWMGSKLKALTCYFGGLASGQEELY